MPINWYSTWDAGVERLNSYAYRHRRSDHLDIVDLDPLSIVDEVLTDPEAAIARSRAMDTARTKVVLARMEGEPSGEERIYRHFTGGRVIGFD
jgi:hypothetical protein